LAIAGNETDTDNLAAGVHGHLRKNDVKNDTARATEGAQINHSARRRPRECTGVDIASEETDTDNLAAGAHPRGGAFGAAEGADINHAVPQRPRERTGPTYADDLATGVHRIGEAIGAVTEDTEINHSARLCPQERMGPGPVSGDGSPDD